MKPMKKPPSAWHNPDIDENRAVQMLGTKSECVTGLTSPKYIRNAGIDKVAELTTLS